MRLSKGLATTQMQKKGECPHQSCPRVLSYHTGQSDEFSLLRWLSSKESACQCRRRGFNPWVRKIPWRRKWQPTLGFLPGKSHRQEPGGPQYMGLQQSHMTYDLILWPPDVKSWLIWKDPDAGKDWKQEKGMTEDEMVGWHHRLNGHEFEQAPGDGEGQGSLACCIPWGLKELDTIEWLNKNKGMISDLVKESKWEWTEGGE